VRPVKRPTDLPTDAAARKRVLVLLTIIAALTYLDRVSISAAAVPIMREFGLSSVRMGYVFSVFALAYALFELPTGWLADRVGARVTLSRIVVCWSAFTLFTGLAWNFGTLMITRFLFGAAEAGAFPTAARALSEWFPVSSRGRVTGILWSGARIGGCMAPPISTLLIVLVGWRWMFAVLGVVGGLAGVAFWRLYRDRADPTTVSEDNQPRGVWKRILMNGSVWALFLMYFASSYGFWFFLTWLPTYLIREHTVSERAAGFYAVLPLAMGSLTCLIGGALADWLIPRTGSIRWSRTIVGCGGFLLTACGFGAATMVHGTAAAMICLTFAAGALDLAVPVAWAACVDVGGRYSGTVSAFMNTAASISAFLSPIVAGWLYDVFGSFKVMFASAAVVYTVGALVWLRIDPLDSIDKHTSEPVTII
jgi:MFS transporter, ACS family, glucarate transporter